MISDDGIHMKDIKVVNVKRYVTYSWKSIHARYVDDFYYQLIYIIYIYI